MLSRYQEHEVFGLVSVEAASLSPRTPMRARCAKSPGKSSGPWSEATRSISERSGPIPSERVKHEGYTTDVIADATIEWLESMIAGFAGAVVFVTHDRAFLGRLATRIVEIDRGRLTSWPGDFDRYLAGKEKAVKGLVQALKNSALYGRRLSRNAMNG